MQNNYLEKKLIIFLRVKSTIACLFIYLFNMECSEGSHCRDPGWGNGLKIKMGSLEEVNKKWKCIVHKF